MKKHLFILLLGLVVFLFSSCDDGRIYPETNALPEGRTVLLEGELIGLENWPSDYRVSIAGFEGADDEYENITLVRLCILDRLRKHIVTFKEVDLSKAEEFVKMDVGTVDISMLNAIQVSYFNTTCANCHGASNRAAAGLYLTEGKSYGALVDVDSKKVEGKKLVAPGASSNSVLHMVLNQQSVEGISMAHYDLVSEKNKMTILPLIDSWINYGAKEK